MLVTGVIHFLLQVLFLNDSLQLQIYFFFSQSQALKWFTIALHCFGLWSANFMNFECNSFCFLEAESTGGKKRIGKFSIAHLNFVGYIKFRKACHLILKKLNDASVVKRVICVS